MGVRFRIQEQPAALFAEVDGNEMSVPALWLRERAQDAAHLDASSHQRLFNPHDLPDDIGLTSITGGDGGAVRVGFSDGYVGDYRLEGLMADFDPHDGCPPVREWTSQLNRMPYHDWSALDDGKAMSEALGDFLSLGFIVLRGVPTTPGSILDVAGRFGHVRDTNFGRLFDVYSRPDANDLAYSALALDPHTDNPYREPVPGVQLLHCLQNRTTGGFSTLVDGLAVGSALKAEDPQAYELLATVPVRYLFTDRDAELMERRTMIRTDDAGRMTGIHYSPRLDYCPLMGEDEMRAFHRARKKLGQFLRDPKFELRFLLQKGELMMFDNVRLLHGRTSFDPQEGIRHLQGCYIDIEGPRSLYRVCRRSA